MILEQFVHSISLKRDKVDSFKAYPFCLPFVKGLENLKLHPKVTFFIGENGTGKSTLLESIALSLAASHGERTRGLVVPSRRKSVVLSESER